MIASRSQDENHARRGGGGESKAHVRLNSQDSAANPQAEGEVEGTEVQVEDNVGEE